jgi:single-stranded DNA-binding protein
MNYTKFMLSGRLVREPESGENKAGKLTKICIAVNRKVGGEDHASFFDIEGWDKMAERLATFEKGQEGFFEGDMYQNTYEVKSKDGKPLKNDEGKPMTRRYTAFKAFNCRYLSKSAKAEQSKKPDSEDDIPWE